MKKLVIMLFGILLLLTSTMSVFASNGSFTEASIPVITNCESNVALADENDNIIEEKVINGTDSFILNLSEIGVYKYKIYQIIDKRNESYIFDDTVYDVQVYVSIDNNELVSVVVANPDGELVKPAEIEFINKEKEKPEEPKPEEPKPEKPVTPTPPKKVTTVTPIKPVSNTSTVTSVKTGDNNNILMWTSICFVSIFILVLLSTYARKKSKN